MFVTKLCIIGSPAW